MFSRFVMLMAVALLLLATPAGAQLLAQDHPGQYTQEDIARGALLYSTPVQSVPRPGRRPDLGHRPPPRSVPALAVRRGPRAGDHARHAGRDAALHAPARGAHRHRRLHSRRVRHDAPRSGSAMRRADGRIFEGKGECATCHRVAGKGPRLAPDLSDIGIARAPAALERSIRDPSSAHAADQSAGAHRDEGRQHDSRTPAERGHATPCRSSTTRSGCVSIAKSGRPDHRTSNRSRRCRPTPAS